VPDGGFRPDGTFVRLPAHSTEVLTEAFRRGLLKLFVARELFEPEVAEGMLEWMHSGLSVHDGVWLDEEDEAGHERLARYCARCPVALERLEDDRQSGTVTCASDKADGPTAGRHTYAAVGFIYWLRAHGPSDRSDLASSYPTPVDCGFWRGAAAVSTNRSWEEQVKVAAS